MKPFFDMSMLAALGYLSLFLVVGIIIRSQLKFVQKALIPSCLIGGLIGMAFMNITGLPGIDPAAFKAIAYHTFTITFICIALFGFSSGSAKSSGKQVVKGTLWMFFMFYISLSMQILLAAGLIYLLNITFFDGELLSSVGFLCAQGFTQGPGQALSTGLLWEKFGFANMGDIAMSFSTMGFLAAFLVGIPLANWGLRCAYGECQPSEIDDAILKGLHNEESQVVAGYQKTHSMNADSLAFMISIILSIWLCSYLLAEAIVPHVSDKIGGTIWGLFFLLAIAIAFIARFTMDRLGIGHYIDRGLLTRVNGVSVEFCILSTITGITLVSLGSYVIPIFVLSVVVSACTLFLMLYFGRRIDGCSFERTIMMFGTCTGTTATGLILLRLVDNDFQTTTAIESGLWNIGSIVVSMLTGTLVHGVVVYGWSMFTVLGSFAGLMIACLICLKVFGLWTKEPQY